MSPKRRAQVSAHAQTILTDLEASAASREELGAAREHLNTVRNQVDDDAISAALAALEVLRPSATPDN